MAPPEAFRQLGEAAEAAWQVVQADIRAKMAELNAQPGMMDAFRGFIAAVDWTEPWIAYLLTFHVLLLTTVILQRRNQAFIGGIFFMSVALVYNAERLNAFARQHWQRFAGQNYFDEHGVFAGALFAAPLLFIMFVILLIYLGQMASLVVRMKRTELRARARRRAAAGNGGGGGGGDGNGSAAATGGGGGGNGGDGAAPPGSKKAA